MKSRLVRIILIVLLVLAVPAGFALWFSYPAWLWFLYPGNPHTAEAKAREAVPYEVLYDTNDNLIEIAVPANVSEPQLRATVIKVANERQDGPARDYLMSSYLWVDAYLVRDGRRSKNRAGRLSRYVPWANPEERKHMKRDRSRFDKFEITLDDAKRSLQ